MNNNDLKWPGEVPPPYGAIGKRDFEEHQKQVDVFIKGLGKRKEKEKPVTK